MDSILQILAACQATYVLGISVMILVHYLINKTNTRNTKWYSIMICLSYIFLNFATITTIFMNYYPGFGVWHLFVIAGYLLGDIASVTAYRNIIKNSIERK